MPTLAEALSYLAAYRCKCGGELLVQGGEYPDPVDVLCMLCSERVASMLSVGKNLEELRINMTSAFFDQRVNYWTEPRAEKGGA